MDIGSKVAAAINKQINREMYSGYLYLGMAAWFETANLPGMASWMKVQASEENEHAFRLWKYLVERNGRVVLDSLETPPKQWRSAMDAFKEAYDHEKKVTAMIYDLVKTAKAENDLATESMLKWFVDEQVEEEANPYAIIQELQMIKESGAGLLMLDKKLAKRGKS